MEGVNSSKVLEHLKDDKAMVVKVLAEVLEASSDTLRDYEEALTG